MTDQPQPPQHPSWWHRGEPPPSPPAKSGVDAGTAQFAVALGIVIALGALGLALVVEGWMTGKPDSVALGAIIGALATALNAPTGISKVLTAAKADP